MHCQSRRLGKTLIVELHGRLDTTTAAAMEDHCRHLVRGGDQVLVLDLGGLEYLSSAGLRSILTVAKQVKAAGGSVALSGAAGMVREVLDMSGFSTIFPLIEPPTEAHHQHA